MTTVVFIGASAVSDNRVSYFLKNQQITANGQPVQFFAGNHYCQPGDTIQMQAEIVDDTGNVQTQINVPLTVKVPLVRHANGQPTTDEIYLNVTLLNGIITASGPINSSGDWKSLTHRNNEALARIGATWKLETADITFLV